MALFNRELKFIYLFEPHTASRAILEHLPKYVPGTSTVNHHHISIQELSNWRKRVLHPKDVLSSRVICTVRNPLDTLVTRWRISGFKHVSFRRFFDNQHGTPAVTNPGMGLFNEAEFFCWYEDLQEDLRWMFNRPQLELGWSDKHKTEGKDPWWSYYEYDMVERLKETYSGYLRKFGYNITFAEGRPFCEIDQDIRARLCQQLL